MTTEVAESPAPEAVVTATPVEAPVSGETKPETEQPPKAERVFTQSELDAVVGERLAKEQRKAQRERDRAVAEAVARAQPKPAEPKANERPEPEKFKTTEEYIEALTDWKAGQVFDAKLEQREKAAREAESRQNAESVSAEWTERVAKVRNLMPDFEDVALNPNLPVTSHMANAVQELERGPEVIYHLGKNPQEAARIARLSPYLQAIELGRIEAKLPEPKPATKTSRAPEPITPVTGGKGGQAIYDTTDPRSTKHLSSSEWIDRENARLAEQYRAKGYR